MRVLFLGGTGLISSACAELALNQGIDLVILTRGRATRAPLPAGAHHLVADRSDLNAMRALLANQRFDAVVDWIAYAPEDVERSIQLFHGKTDQFVFISSASAYQKPPAHYLITEETPLSNPYWEYSRQKIACEERLWRAQREQGFPITIVRPSLTYGPSQIPLCVGSWQHPYTVIERMRQGRPIIIPGDGTSLWTLTWNADFATGLVGLLGNPRAIGEAVHITADEVLTWDQIYRETARAIGVEPQIVPIPSSLIAQYDADARGSLLGDKAHSMVFDNRKIKSLVPTFRATVPWSEGVRRAIAWHEADPARCTIDHAANQLWDQIIAAYQRAIPARR